MKRTFTQTIALVSAVVSLTAMALATAGAATATEPAATTTPPKWRPIAPAVTSATSGISSVVATGQTTGWAFGTTRYTQPVNAKIVSLERTGRTSWKRVAFPATYGFIPASAASSPTDVWAAVQNSSPNRGDLGTSTLYRWNGTKWTAAHTFHGNIRQLSVVARNDIWVFGPAHDLGVWHYDGHNWKRVASTLSGGCALTDTDVWAVDGTSVAHFNGTKWAAVSLAKLLPSKALSFPPGTPSIADVVALSTSNVYAIGVGRHLPHGGPLVILHYNGRTWAKAATGEYSFAGLASPDAKGGFWFPSAGGDGNQVFVHYSRGKLASVRLPNNSVIETVSRIPGTAGQLAGGFWETAGSTLKLEGAILQFS
jgi:hypothetical protein